MVYQGVFGVLIFIVVSLSLSIATASADDVRDHRGDLGKINDPVQDAKQSFHGGTKEFVGIKLEQEMLTPGLKPEQAEVARKQYRVRALNKRWRTEANIEEDPRRMNQLKRYANRYNLTMIRLVEQEQLDQKLRYRY